ncbi:MAG: F0F1 ATP synthase subunit delta [Clostridium sp.]
MFEFLDKRYALAIYKIAEEKDKVNEFIEVLKEISTLIDTDEDLKEIAYHPQISTSEKKLIFQKIFKGKIDDDILSFLELLIEKGRLVNLDGILVQLKRIRLNKMNTVEGVVKSVIPLTDEEYGKLLEKLEKKYKKHILLDRQIDKNLIGGLFVQVENEIIDGSLKSKYEDMKLLMMEK